MLEVLLVILVEVWVAELVGNKKDGWTTRMSPSTALVPIYTLGSSIDTSFFTNKKTEED